MAAAAAAAAGGSEGAAANVVIRDADVAVPSADVRGGNFEVTMKNLFSELSAPVASDADMDVLLSPPATRRSGVGLKAGEGTGRRRSRDSPAHVDAMRALPWLRTCWSRVFLCVSCMISVVLLVAFCKRVDGG